MKKNALLPARPDMTGLPCFTILQVEIKLTDTSASAKVPDQLPAFNPPYAKLNGRTIGGAY